jgi:hypothetical protein
MTKLARPRKSICSARLILTSVRLSIALVASSRMRILVLASMAREMQISCRWPAEIPAPSSKMTVSRPNLLEFLAATEAVCYGEYPISGDFRMGKADVVAHCSGKKEVCW